MSRTCQRKMYGATLKAGPTMAPIADLSGATTIAHVVEYLCYRDTRRSLTEPSATDLTTVVFGQLMSVPQEPD